MTVHPFDHVLYHGELCVVEACWETPDASHTPFCSIRPERGTGTFFVEQSILVPCFERDHTRAHREAA